MSSWLSALPLASSPGHEAFLYILFIAIMALVKKSLHRYTRHPDD